MFKNRFMTTRLAAWLLAVGLMIIAMAGAAIAHPLGNFTINHYARIHIHDDRIAIRYVIDMAEIPAFQELQSIGAERDSAASSEKLNAYAEQSAARYAAGLLLTVDGSSVSLRAVAASASTPAGAGNLPTLRIECDFQGEISAINTGATHRVHFEDANFRERAGWRETIVSASSGISVFNSTAYGNGITDELKAYPEDSLSAPLNERVVEFSFTKGAAPSGANALLTRDGRAVVQSRDRFAELIAVSNLTPLIALLGLLIAAALGALHALSPGHGKTVVGAYLVGSRGTARHAAFLGFTVTVTHTVGVFALGIVTLFASQYVLPEKLFPILSLVSGAIVVAIGLSLFVTRLRAALGNSGHKQAHHAHSHRSHRHADDQHSHHAHHHDHEQADDHSHHDHDHAHDEASDSSLVHSHGGRAHSHLPPGADGGKVTWRSLLALGISGGLLPCPSALVVLLSAISLHRVGYGLLLVVAFSIGLATTLTLIGLAFVYAGRLMKRAVGSNRLVRTLPVVSAFVIACAGAVICYEALISAGFSFSSFFNSINQMFTDSMARGNTVTTASVLAVGLVFGVKHAIEADHIAAVSTIVSERKSVLSSSLVGGLWGIGHTISLLIAGVAVIFLRVQISERVALGLEFCVALMLIALGADAIRRLVRGGKLHVHPHRHGGVAHLHPHIHDESGEAIPATHHRLRMSARPLVVGMIHGLAGSAALMLLVLSTVPSRLVGFAYIGMFGLGSIGGMMIMSALVSLPVQLTANRFNRMNHTVRMLAAIFSLAFGLYMAYEISFQDRLFG